MISSEQRYAQAAYSSMTEGLGTEEAAIFGSICHQFPAMVRLNGLRLAVIFYEAKAGYGEAVKSQTNSDGTAREQSTTEKKARSQAYSRFLKYMKRALELKDTESLSDLLKNDAGNGSSYRLLTRQALAASVWFKRYAEAILKVEATADQDGGGK